MSGRRLSGSSQDGRGTVVGMSSSALSRRVVWLVPAAVVLVVLVSITIPRVVASAAPSLPHRSAAQLLVDVAHSGHTPLAGTVVETARLGLPALPEVGDTSISPTSLLAGSHTARVWYDGRNSSRIALVGNLAETDLLRNGRDVWLWTSGKNTAQHARLPASAPRGVETPTPTLTPQDAARRALAAVDPSTRVTVDGTAKVAGRSAYELVLQPRDHRSLVGDVRIAVDSATGVPLRVQVHARGATGRPAFETTFTSVSFSRPSADVFRFTPPPGAKVSTLGLPTSSKGSGPAVDHPDTKPVVHGSGWAAVVELSGVSLPQSGGPADGGRESGGNLLSSMGQAMTPVHGAFGTGQELRTTLVSFLLLDDGRLFVGAVPPAVLEQAAS
ncbi:MAG: hypothetical protein QOJ60_2672 [Actinomycetota bacterium]|nr:hypothetical protein [Actinomycetota bacterium]